VTRTALVLDGDSGPALAAVRSLGRGGWRVVTGEGTRSARSRYVTATARLPDVRVDRDAAAEALVRAAVGVDVVVPSTDASLELAWRVQPELGGARIVGGDRATVAVALDKASTLGAAERHGFPVPAWTASASPAGAAEALALVGVPAVVKPRRSFVPAGRGLAHRRHSFARTVAELERELERQAEPDGSPPVVQAFVPGRSLSATAVVRDGRVLAFAARETLSAHPIAGGNSVWRRTVARGEPGVEEALALLLALGLDGLAEVEFQVGADGSPRLMEIGARVHGWTTLAMRAGADLPLVAARALLGDELPDAAPYAVGAQMRWPGGELGRLRDAFRHPSRLPPGTTRLDVLRTAWPPWAPGMGYDGLDLDDPGPWLPVRARPRSGRR
jgi:predicted ATP-grasp superfamily ATP-dependent carboligase